MSNIDYNEIIRLINDPESTREQRIAAIEDAYSKLPEDQKKPTIITENAKLIPIIGKSILHGFTSDKEAMDAFNEDVRKEHNNGIRKKQKINNSNANKPIGGKKRKTRKVKKGKKTKKSKKSRKYKK